MNQQEFIHASDLEKVKLACQALDDIMPHLSKVINATDYRNVMAKLREWRVNSRNQFIIGKE